ncbi:MAG: metalloregulator ArsR/SmtB family transcription factor [Brevundimonas sp.]|uniref:ArsR/SmtB family transcription factor n=1 Tax=Brevundimonas sp. TaxID=1871086 RepID=UPI00256D7AB9|nr:metalloregulator ArsR/SmtB family transcription factor [Brevundimonas sp.]MDK2747019.1 metalloregulator ArsR/SmtB family transcription factor [Brevundimonas sp.]
MKLDDGTLDEVLRALAHPDRRRFWKACLDQERSAGDLAALSDLALASVSEHLKVLRKTGLLTLEKRGRFWFYRADRPALAAVVESLRLLEGDDGT